ncbi:MAG: 3' terminal RNA ribose 2'-O-methyltransferase Hen1 [Deltaproteobacteria bacterium]|nr:3' terminal RNA ribose 2'-O-methyltransferase Hen1 [Deltaproteobacteria bacterium]
MLLTITYEGENAADLGYLLHKNPYRPQEFKVSHGRAYVFYPELSERRATAALLLDIDPIGLVRGKDGARGGGLFDYVNDRPYASSSFMSVAISQVYGTAMSGRSESRQELADSPLDLTAKVVMQPCRDGRTMLERVFGPLGYEISCETFPADESFPAWGESGHVNLTLRGRKRLRDLLRHLYVLIPVFDRQKHYWVGADEVDKLVRLGEDWLPDHPEKGFIARRFLKRQRPLVNMALERLAEANATDGEILPVCPTGEPTAALDLNARRLERVARELKARNVKKAIDLGCGDGRLMAQLAKDPQFTLIVGMDASHAALARAEERLRLKDAGDALRERVRLFQGGLTYRDSRLEGFDAACAVEVIEHLDPPRLEAFAGVVFGKARPRVIVLTTPNREYNANYPGLPPGALRHPDHRFEWTRAEFRDWVTKISERFGYGCEFGDIGDSDPDHGTPTQMAVFTIS